MIEPQESAELTPQVTNLSQVDVETVNAELVRMHQSSAGTVNSEDVELTTSFVAAVQAKNVTLKDSIAAAVEAGDLKAQGGAVGVAQVGTLSLNGAAGVVVAGSADLGNAYAGLVAAGEVRGERIESIILLSRKVEGNVTTVIDTRGALIAGLVGGSWLVLAKVLALFMVVEITWVDGVREDCQTDSEGCRRQLCSCILPSVDMNTDERCL